MKLLFPAIISTLTTKKVSREYLDKYYNEHKEEIIRRVKENYRKNKEECKLKAKEYYQKNKDRIKTRELDRYYKKKEETWKSTHGGSLEGYVEKQYSKRM